MNRYLKKQMITMAKRIHRPNIIEPISESNSLEESFVPDRDGSSFWFKVDGDIRHLTYTEFKNNFSKMEGKNA